MSAPTRAADDPITLTCPNKQTTILTGSGAPPYESLIAYLSARPVGGGSARQDGSWRIPLLLNEKPGVYLVEVKVRGSRALVGSFTCFVDVSIGTPEAVAPTEGAQTPSAPAPTLTTPPTAAPAPTGGTASPTRSASPTRTTTAPAGTDLTSTPSATSSATSSAATRTATATASTTTAGQGTNKMRISDVFCRDPAYPDDSEYIELRNDGESAVSLVGWKITNISRSNVTYTFPSYTVDGGPDVYVTLYSGIGTNRPDFAEFYWNRTDQLWFVGDRAELRDAAGNLVDAYLVTASNCS